MTNNFLCLFQLKESFRNIFVPAEKKDLEHAIWQPFRGKIVSFLEVEIPPSPKKMRGTNTAFAVQVICSEMGGKGAPSQSTNDIARHGNKCATTRKQTGNNNNVTTVDC